MSILCEEGCWLGLIRHLCLRDIAALVSCSRAIHKKYTSELVWNHICEIHQISFEVPVKNPLKHICSPKLKVAGHWRFNFWEGGDLSKALDHSGNKFHVKMVGGARYVDDGVGMFIPPRENNAPLPTCTAQNPKIYDISSKFTVEAIIRPNTKATKQEIACPIVSKHSHLCGWELRFSSTPSFLVTIECNFFESKAKTNIPLEDRWYHIAGIYDSSSVTLLVDYKEVGTFQLPKDKSFKLKHCGQPLTFGNSPAWAERCLFDGIVKEVRICHSVVRVDQMLRRDAVSFHEVVTAYNKEMERKQPHKATCCVS